MKLYLNLQQHNPESNWSDEDSLDVQIDDEKPVVVVLRPGDLTAEEAETQAVLDGHQQPGAEGMYMFKKKVRVFHQQPGA